MASVHALPVELLARVFMLGMLDAPPMSSTSPFPPDPPFEVLASHVCAHWRAVALRTPALWTHIALATVHHIPRARAYLARSTRHPLHLLIDSASEPEHAANPALLFRDSFLPAFAPFTPHIARWASLVLRVRDLACKAHARTVLSTCGPAPRLAALDLWHIEDWGSPERLYTAIGPPPVVVFAGTLPALSRLSLIGVNIQWAASASPFLRALTDLELGVHSDDVRIPFARWRAMLAASPGLRRLSLHYSGPRAQTGPWRLGEDGPVVLPTLSELRLVDLDAPYVCALLRTLRAPGLRHLHLELGDMDAVQDFSPLAHLLAHPPPDEDAVDPTMPYLPPPAPHAGPPMFPALETLSIAALAEGGPEAWARALGRMGTLCTLEADFGAMGAGAFDVLWAAPREPVHGLGALSLVAGEAGEDGGKGKRREDAKGACDDSATAGNLLLPALHTLRVSGVSGVALAALARYRRERGRPIRLWYVHESCRDPEAEAMKAEMDARGREQDERMEWFRDEDEDEEGEMDGAESVVGEGEEEAELEGECEGTDEGAGFSSGSSDSEGPRGVGGSGNGSGNGHGNGYAYGYR